MSRAKLWKNKLGNFLVIWLIFALVFFWVFSGWPQIWQKPAIPPEIEIAKTAPDTLTLRPNAAGTYQAWATFGAGTAHWDRTSDVADATGVQVTTSTTDKETENLADASQSGTINSVTAYIRAQATGSGGPEKAVIVWRTVSTDYESGTNNISRTAFTDYSETRTTNPNTGAAWTWAQVNALEIGSRASTLSTGEVIQVSEYWIVVDYTPAAAAITVTDGVVAYGVVNLGGFQNTTPSGVNETQLANNTGTAAETFRIKSNNAIRGGGTTWTLSTLTGVNQFNHTASIDGGSTWNITMNTADTYYLLKSNVAVNNIVNVDLQVGMPTDTDDSFEHTIYLTIMAEIY